jgi:signal transduction histidine kinase
MVRGAALRKRLHIAFSTEVDGLVVLADERIVKQIVVNLLGNAIKFTPEGGAIGLEAYKGEGGRVLCFCVWDTGIGIAERDIQRLFQPFVQLDAGLNRQFGGTGLGLALAARLAEQHGGKIDVTSEPGAGSRFTLTLPVVEAMQAGL